MIQPDSIRAQIVGRRMSVVVKRKGWRPSRESWTHWYMTVTDGKKVIHADDCRDLAKLHDSASASVASFRNLARLGYKFRSWADLVDEARL